MRTFSLKKRLMLLTTSLIIGIVCVGLFIVWPVIHSINSLGESIAQTELYLEDQYLRSQRMQRSVRELDDVEAYVTKFKDLTVPPGADLELITGLEALAEAHAIEQSLDIQYHEEKERGQSGYYDVSFLNHGRYINHLAYLRTLEELPYYVQIKSLSWERRPSPAEDGSVLVTLSFTARIYASDS